MGFLVPVTVRLVPGDNTFTCLLNAQDRLRDYGWTTVAMDSGPAGKITAVQDRTIVFTLDGRSDATDGTAQDDVKSALKNTGVWEHVIDGVTSKIAAIPTKAAAAAGEAAGQAASGAVKGAGAPLTLAFGAFALLALAVGVGVAVVAFKRG